MSTTVEIPALPKAKSASSDVDQLVITRFAQGGGALGLQVNVGREWVQVDPMALYATILDLFGFESMECGQCGNFIPHDYLCHDCRHGPETVE